MEDIYIYISIYTTYIASKFWGSSCIAIFLELLSPSYFPSWLSLLVCLCPWFLPSISLLHPFLLGLLSDLIFGNESIGIHSLRFLIELYLLQLHSSVKFFHASVQTDYWGCLLHVSSFPSHKELAVRILASASVWWIAVRWKTR
eukprot:Blabericola_migrator_1__9710@NODE_5314_length_811_cov_4_102151_g3407_i0_p1_GENE_NODE_5314_length_811_cov_4_102151_g3407_i0NODE_5314_length_811_cov_4_102151_g3407_i0_p1_ORF_typecomplete_len144_score5_73Acyl_CoA_thio/PF02551_15/0_004_NODE_5314_length_811_cov_4_102151_g3407_i033464